MLAAVPLAGQSQDAGETSRFFVVFRGVRIGSEAVTVSRASGTFTITSRGQIGPPLDLITNKFQMVYTLDWQPRTLAIEAFETRVLVGRDPANPDKLKSAPFPPEIIAKFIGS